MDSTIAKRELYLMQQIYSTLTSLTRKLDKLVYTCFDNLTARQYMALLVIQKSPNGETSMISIAKNLETSKQNVNQIIAALEKKRYAIRSAREDNKRSVRVEVTNEGRKAMQAYSGIGASVMTEIFDGFSKSEMETLLCLLYKLYSHDSEALR